METEGTENLRKFCRSLVIEGLKKREALPRLTLDFDGAVLSTKGQAEGTVVGSNKKKKGSAAIFPCSLLWHKRARFSTYTIGLEMFTILTTLMDL